MFTKLLKFSKHIDNPREADGLAVDVLGFDFQKNLI